MVSYLNGLSDSTFAVSVRVWRTKTTRCCDFLGSIGLSVFPYPQGCAMNPIISSESSFHVVLIAPKKNKPNRWESTAPPNSLALKRDMLSVQVGGNVDRSKDNA